MDARTIIFIHEYLTEFFLKGEDPIEPPGVKNHDAVESAAARPYATAGGRDAYPTVYLKAAALFHSIACNHSFHNGNKRTALLSTLYYLSEHNLWLDRCSDDEMYEFTRQTAAHEIAADRRDEVAVIADWLQRKSRKQQKGEKPLKLTELREVLARFDFHLEDHGKTLEVLKDGRVVETILKKGVSGFEDYDPHYISELRKRLNLVVEDGVDSLRFYGQKGLSDELNDFMQMRLEVMKRLAKT
ncbi:MAG: death-on-curing family protein [Gammaproteobacteria bacterium]|nr:death-on-curing family protein [Gammaproteobacteria bacterium]